MSAQVCKRVRRRVHSRQRVDERVSQVVAEELAAILERDEDHALLQFIVDCWCSRCVFRLML